ncbi:TRAUB-domain-containing protein [Pholiota conissans]|uniref:Protein BFR2 n=1 Tax=Pholiota conissans TaxID=109636 RepID=A0A9P5Z1I3_9AGAR|nr:TRAUB-domain-containing protein [Pholiota conissans]
MATERLSLAEQIAQLEEAAPVDYDPEDLQTRGGDDAMDLDAGATREHYFEVGPSILRNQLPSVADPKYEGVRVSRKQLLEDSDEGLVEDDENDDGDVEHPGHGESGEQGIEDGDDVDSDHNEEGFRDHLFGRRIPAESEGSEANSEEEGKEEEEEEEERQEEHQRQVDDEPSEDVTSTLKKSRETDIKKGQAVKRQLALWDTLLDTRIRLQKSVVSANGLPPPSHMKEYLESEDCRDSLSKFLDEASKLTDELLELQENVLTTNNVIQPPPRKRRKLDAEISLDQYPGSFISATEDIASLEQAFHPYLLQTLSKWSSKIQAVAPSVLLPSNRGAFSKGNQNLKSVVQLIDDTLHENDKLLKRTQVTRVKKMRIGVQQEEVVDADDIVDPEAFDDTDFYQKMLRDIIDARGNRNKNEDWMLLQKQKKAKKKVDTKASKGRKLRYEVHEKLQNFMVPVPVPGAWHDEQVDELFASLLGKGFDTITLNVEEPQVQRDIAVGGFRVFG